MTANDTNMPKSSMIVSQQTGIFDADILIVSEVGVLDSSIELSAVAPITKNADDKIPANWSSTMNGSNSASVSTNCQHIAEAVAYMNYAFTEQAFMAVNWGTEGVTYTMENGAPQFTDLMLNNPNLPASFTPLAYISPGFPFLKSYDMTLASYDYPRRSPAMIFLPVRLMKACQRQRSPRTTSPLPRRNPRSSPSTRAIWKPM